MNSGGNAVTNELTRRGNVTKCPVCGCGVDAEAYCCPTCRSYFCYHCRARVQPDDEQFQCDNQSCDYYGRLLCAVCDPSHRKEEEPTVYREPRDGFWPLFLLLSLAAGGYAWWRFRLVWESALLVALAAFGVLALLIRLTGRSAFLSYKEVEQRRVIFYHTCVRCGEVARKLDRKR